MFQFLEIDDMYLHNLTYLYLAAPCWEVFFTQCVFVGAKKCNGASWWRQLINIFMGFNGSQLSNQSTYLSHSWSIQSLISASFSLPCLLSKLPSGTQAWQLETLCTSDLNMKRFISLFIHASHTSKTYISIHVILDNIHMSTSIHMYIIYICVYIYTYMRHCPFTKDKQLEKWWQMNMYLYIYTRYA